MDSATAGPTTRVDGIDIARALAALMMVQGHAYDGWVAPAHKTEVAYLVTRFFGMFPLPAFLFLAGVGVAWRLLGAVTLGEDARPVRRQLVRRGLTIVAWGYAVNVVCMLIDGGIGFENTLRVDVLHAIGLSIALFAAVGIAPTSPPDRRPDLRRAMITAVVGAGVVTAITPWLARLTRDVTGPARFLAALASDVPSVGKMPLVPLAAWFCAGVLVAQGLHRAGVGVAVSRTRADAPVRFLLVLTASGVALGFAGRWLTQLSVDLLGGTLSRAHVGVWFNIVELLGRAIALLGVALLLPAVLPDRTRRLLVCAGRHSLAIYVAHIPFCYGRFGKPLAASLTTLGATPFVALLIAASLALACLLEIRPRVTARLRR